MVGNLPRSGFAIAWQEDPDGLRPGKGKGPGEGWSGAISNHKTDIWYTYITQEDFAIVDEHFVPAARRKTAARTKSPAWAGQRRWFPSLCRCVSPTMTWSTRIR